jgi:hypothetical protein
MSSSYVRVLFWDEYNERYSLADNVVLDSDGGLDMSAIARMWGLKRIAVTISSHLAGAGKLLKRG